MVIVKTPLLSHMAWGKQRGSYAQDAPIPPNDHDPELCIYQRRRGKDGMICVKEKYYKPSNPPSSAQKIRRQRFAAAVRAWQGMSADRRIVWQAKGATRNLPAYHAFLRDYLRGSITK